jgi:hypothetical protein
MAYAALPLMQGSQCHPGVRLCLPQGGELASTPVPVCLDEEGL